MKMPPLARETKYPKPPGAAEIPVKGPSPPAPVALGDPYHGASKFETVPPLPDVELGGEKSSSDPLVAPDAESESRPAATRGAGRATWPGPSTGHNSGAKERAKARETTRRVKRRERRFLLRAGEVLAAPTGFEPVSPP